MTRHLAEEAPRTFAELAVEAFEVIDKADDATRGCLERSRRTESSGAALALKAAHALSGQTQRLARIVGELAQRSAGDLDLDGDEADLAPAPERAYLGTVAGWDPKAGRLLVVVDPRVVIPEIGARVYVETQP